MKKIIVLLSVVMVTSGVVAQAKAKKARKPSSAVHCTAMSSSEELEPTKFKVTSKGNGHTEEFQFKSWGFFYGAGMNKNTLSVKKDGKPVFQAFGNEDLHTSVILDPNAPDDKLPAIVVDCEE